MTDNTDHSSRRKPQNIIDQAKSMLKEGFSWKHIGFAVLVFALAGLVFVLGSWIAPASMPSLPAVDTGNWNGVSIPFSNSTLFLIALVAIGLAFIPWRWSWVKHLSAAIAIICLVLIAAPTVSSWLPCSPTDVVCQQKAAETARIKEEQRRRQELDTASLKRHQPVSQGCNVDRRAHYFPATKPAYKVNEGGKCAVALFIEGHCVYYTQNYNDNAAGIICVYNGATSVSDLRGNRIEMPEDVDRVWSANGVAFNGSIGLWQPRYTKLLSIR